MPSDAGPGDERVRPVPGRPPAVPPGAYSSGTSALASAGVAPRPAPAALVSLAFQSSRDHGPERQPEGPQEILLSLSKSLLEGPRLENQ